MSGTPASAAPPTPGVIANLWNWNWKSVATECTTVLGPAGYAAVQVAPPQDSMTQGGSVWWDVYQPARYELTSKFGNEAAFRSMVDACHAAGVKVQVDAVINHMTGMGSTSYGGYAFGKYNYPGLYTASDFHTPTCAIGNYGDASNVQNCELVGLSDLNTGSDAVRTKIAGYLDKLTGLGVDGFRIDAAKHISPADLAAIKAKLTGPAYFHQEVIAGGSGEAVQPSQYTGIGDVDEFVYGRRLREHFLSGQIKNLNGFGESSGLSVPSDKAVVFVANHDTERGGSTLSYKDGGTYRLANVFMLAWPFGTPSVYSGFTFGNPEAGPPSSGGGLVTDTDCSNGQWNCLDREMSGMVGFHNAVRGTAVANWTDDGNNLIAFSRGAKGWVAINNGTTAVSRSFTTGLPAGTYQNLAGSGSVSVNASGVATVSVAAKSAVAIRAGASSTPSPSPTTPPPTGTATVYYKTTWTTANIHYGINGTWTTVPGVPMDAPCAGWKKKTVDLGGAATFQVTFNNGSGTWDNNNGRDYTLGTGVSTVQNGVVTGNAADPCGTGSPSPSPSVSPTPTAGNTATVFYYKKTRGWASANIHYQPTGGSWTTVPGVPMNETTCADWAKKTIALGSAGGLKAAFNNGSGTWDNNNGADYAIGLGTTTVKDGVVRANAPEPCVPEPPDTTPPTVPTGLTTTASGTTVRVAWNASTDNVGVTGYEISRVTGTGAPLVRAAGATTYNDSGLDAQTTYAYQVRALDAAGNRSAYTTAVSVRTGDAPPPPTQGTPLGGDPRDDTIYFVMTARFYDGDTSNNRGGSQNIRSGNAANNDPMFRGDFKGLIDKLDYIKGLGFSAIWITPVILNRSDYDFHGYHGWDFYRVDTRLETPGAGYQDLINKAHAKGIKIFQDVVYNHSSRWGAKGLYVPPVYGVRDEQWKWLYSRKDPSAAYDPMVEHQGNDPDMTPAQNEMAKGRPYNGDLWSTEEPTGNTCRSWGTPTQYFSPEGYRIYNCQWPSPTSGMFPSALYHQCWIGNWEGEDSRSCWLHEDLADFNTENAQVQKYLIDAYNRYIDMGVDGFRVDTAVHVPRVTWNRRFLPAIYDHITQKFGAGKAKDFYIFGEVAAFVNDKWNRGSVNHSAQFYTWKERKDYSADDVAAALEQYDYEEQLGPGNQPTSTNAFLNGNAYHAPDHAKFSGMNIIDMRMHMNFSDAQNAFNNGKDSDDSTNDATYNAVYVDSHDYGPNKSGFRYTGGTDAWAENMSLMWTFRGIPTLYYGSEIEFQKGKPVDCGPTCPLATTGRAYYGDKIEGSVTASDFGVVSSASGPVATTLSQPLVKHVQRLNQIRRAIPALRKGQYATQGVTGQMAYKRRFTEGSVDSFVLVTISGNATFTGIPNGRYVDAVTGDSRTVTDGTLSISLTGKGNMRAYVLDLPGNPAPGRIGADGPYLK
ncbi:carbohydrate binding domain-containing protein [Sphaerisporangium album]|nr:alpha-amylase family glycosyl hydrolase [Sphaerisporangium album]